MEISVNDPEASNYEVIDLTDNQPIRGVQWADDACGLYIVFVKNEKEEIIWERDNLGNNFPKVELKRGNIKLVKKEEIHG
jgi:hypothetical protein